MNQTMLKEHGDIGIMAGGLLATTVAGFLNHWVEILIGIATLIYIGVKIFIGCLKARMAWKQRNNTSFFEHQDKE